MSQESEPEPAGTVASVPAGRTNGAPSVAETLQAIEQLSSVFGFDWDVAHQAVDAVGPDISLAYNYILDNGLGVDRGGPIVPIKNCPHVLNHVLVTPSQLPSPQARCDHGQQFKAPTGGAKSDVKEDGYTCPDGENWVCLECGVVRCSRYVNAHGLLHWEETKNEDGVGHCIAASLADLSVWCHECNAYLHDANLDPLVQRLEELKFETKDDHEQDRDEAPNSFSARDVGRGMPLDVLSNYDEVVDRPSYPFEKLPSSLKDVADFILSDKCRSIVVLAGAGMSVASGIPDFRSSGGLYETLRPELLTATAVEREAIRVDPTTALSQTLFLQNQFPCLELKRPFMLGTRDKLWKATLAHRFVELLHVKTGKLTRLYTQNIDGLEGQCTELPQHKVVPVHGSMDRAECANCGLSAGDFEKFCNDVQRNIKDISGQDPTAPPESSEIRCENCGHAALKPSIVLFRASLPKRFFDNVQNDIPHVDLLIVVGTSLTVAPANTLVYRIPSSALRVVVNRDKVGRRLGIQYDEDSERDYFAQGDCDEVLLDLMYELGWTDDLSSLVDDLPEFSAKLLRERLAELSTEAKK